MRHHTRTAWVGLLFLAVLGSLWGCGADPEEEISLDPSELPPELAEVEPTGTDWPWWRGPNRDNVSPATDVPTQWDEDTHIVWKTKIPGRGHASPTIWGDRIFLATADESAETQSVLCYDKETGKELWAKELHSGGFADKGHQKSSQATPTIACDGERIFVPFLNSGAVWLTALSLEGEKLWETEVGKFSPKFGYSPSPTIYKSFVILAADHQSGGYLAALHRKTGDILWRKNRPAEATYASTLLAHVDDQDQLLIAGADIVAGYNPQNGEQLWEVDGTTASVASTMAASGDYVIASGGYPGSQTLCLRLGGSQPEIVWETNQKSYVPSLLIHEGTLYQVHDNGRMTCLDLETGEKLWQGRLPGSDISASPVYADGHIYVINERGKCFVIKATREAFDLVAENQLGDEAFATPTIVDSRIYFRVADSREGGRQEFLYCVGK